MSKNLTFCQLVYAGTTPSFKPLLDDIYASASAPAFLMPIPDVSVRCTGSSWLQTAVITCSLFLDGRQL